MFKKLLNFLFGSKNETAETPNTIHEEIAKTLKEREEILKSIPSEDKPKKTRAPRKPKAEVSVSKDKATKVKPVVKVKKEKTTETTEKPKRTRKPKTDK